MTVDLYQKFDRLCISSTGGGGGKTLLSLGLGRALVNLTKCVQPFKKGPDYIDAAWLSLACRRQTTNLDPYFLDAKGLRDLFIKTMLRCPPKSFGLIEGNRGLYDGLDENGVCSTAAVCRALDCPILLCVNCEKSTRTVAAILRGITDFETGLKFCGVILNRVGSSRHEKALRQSIEKYCSIPVLGALPRMAANPLPERHMGLASSGSNLAENANHIIDSLADFVSQNCDIPAILELARKKSSPLGLSEPAKKTSITVREPKPVIGYVRDKALWFYYPENLQDLRDAGAELVELSLFDQNEKNSWQNLDGLYLGGGFPEDFAQSISASPFLKLISAYAYKGIPIYAECGGLMILVKSIITNTGEWPMCGIFPHTIKWLPVPQGLGYVNGTIIAENPFFEINSQLRGHEFHYSRCFDQKEGNFALELKRGNGFCKGGQKALDGLIYKNVWASYMHIFSPAAPGWASNFVKAASAAQK